MFFPVHENFYLFSAGTYIYIEATYRNREHSASLVSPKIYPKRDNDERSLCFAFFYHMYGRHMGTLNINFIEAGSLQLHNLWSRSGEVGQEWLEGQVHLKFPAPGFLIIEGIVGVKSRSDIAIDDVSLFECEGMKLSFNSFFF